MKPIDYKFLVTFSYSVDQRDIVTSFKVKDFKLAYKLVEMFKGGHLLDTKHLTFRISNIK